MSTRCRCARCTPLEAGSQAADTFVEWFGTCCDWPRSRWVESGHNLGSAEHQRARLWHSRAPRPLDRARAVSCNLPKRPTSNALSPCLLQVYIRTLYVQPGAGALRQCVEQLGNIQCLCVYGQAGDFMSHPLRQRHVPI